MTDRSADASKQPTFSITMAKLGFNFSTLALLLATGSGFGSRLGFWDFRTGFNLLEWGARGGIAGAVVSLIALVGLGGARPLRAFFLGLIGLLVGLTVFAVPLQWRMTARKVPPIHDITTDTENPPRFVAILKRREGAPNSAEYGGEEIAAQQRTGYPDLRPMMSGLPVDQVFSRALATARELGWEIVETDLAEGRIEATDTTFWYGFKDDVIVRINPAENGSRVDVRSVSRVGRSDVGTNAKRIEKFLKELKEKEKE